MMATLPGRRKSEEKKNSLEKSPSTIIMLYVSGFFFADGN